MKYTIWTYDHSRAMLEVVLKVIEYIHNHMVLFDNVEVVVVCNR